MVSFRVLSDQTAYAFSTASAEPEGMPGHQCASSSIDLSRLQEVRLTSELEEIIVALNLLCEITDHAKIREGVRVLHVVVSSTGKDLIHSL